MPTPAELQEALSSRTARQPFWKTKKDEHVEDSKFSPSDGSRPVISVRVVANQVFGRTGQANALPVQMAHFRILLVLDESVEHPASVGLNSTGVSSNGIAKLVVSSHNWILSVGNTTKFADEAIYPVQGKTLTVDDILNILFKNNRHHYKLHGSGSGCRYWTKVVLSDLVDEGYLARGADGKVAAITENISRDHPDVLMLANADGEFFK